jgi:predicted nucleic-acid-binding protein
MIAVDTNVLVRFLVRDDGRQSARAAALIRANEIWIPKSVLLETEWVLRSLYGFHAERLAGALRALAGLPTVFLEDGLAVAKALDWFEKGLDFADGLHLASSLRSGSGEANEFATFDRKLAREATRIAAIEAIAL